MITCTTCNTPTDRLEIFPGDVCPTCWADSPQGRRIMSTIEQLIKIWKNNIDWVQILLLHGSRSVQVIPSRVERIKR